MGVLTGDPNRPMDRATHDVDFRGPSGNSNSNSGNQGGKGGPGKTDNGVPIQDKPTPTTTPLPLIPDVEHQAPDGRPDAARGESRGSSAEAVAELRSWGLVPVTERHHGLRWGVYPLIT